MDLRKILIGIPLAIGFFISNNNLLASSLFDIRISNGDGLVNYSEDSTELEDIRSFYRKVFGNSYDINWKSLIDKYGSSGSVGTVRYPYYDSWYPEISGGTNVNINSDLQAVVKDKVFVDDPRILGALDRYDKAFYGGESRAADWEIKNHSRTKPSWYGHCNGTSVAVARFQNPVKSVYRPQGCKPSRRDCIKFTPRDIRALLSEIGMNAKAKFISGNRCSKSKEEIKKERRRVNSDPMDACQDVNPASFHLGLVNFLGRQKQTLIFDKSMDSEVWNYPIYRYRFNYEKVSVSTALDTLKVDEPSWVFNPLAKDFVRVKMDVFYRDPLTRDFEGAGSTSLGGKYYTLQYILELDASDNVIGGEWAAQNYRSHPDFLWMPFEPIQPSGSSGRGNPFIKNDEVIKIWADSMGFSKSSPFINQPPNIAFDVKFYPDESDVWGQNTGYYNVSLNGLSTPYIFDDGPATVIVNTGGKIRDGADFEVQLNNKVIARKTIIGRKASFLINPESGLSTLKLVWKNASVKPSVLNWTYWILKQ